ncbi:undecaprenyl diphosphate synthase family protein [Clostridium sp. 'White wine YQ']|uniref:undecaprenyl diphosphate synthase family protein n=1 Tax=Clostridium sp. 'White wine YQ' TaxID=3027474 RepID=UPI0023655A1D|nr:undecaprenyl diphosphate synthase family protein [Clostridium sp. 'White wine YQ']MDD7796377.1 undecaprenyl diphosphate synthase family protein [Clostridium sp. 'White wine YQ']
MNLNNLKRIPSHIGIIPDGNRRWALNNNKDKHEGYEFGIDPGFKLYETCLALGIKELTFYGFTIDNTKRPAVQTKAFQKACVDAVMKLSNKDANLLVVGNSDSPLFPKELLPYANRRVHFGEGLININFLVNYGWNWDLSYNKKNNSSKKTSNLFSSLASSDISRIDLIIRWGGRRRLSGFLPLQSVYSDFYIIDDYWPDFREEHLLEALNWYQGQDITLGG